MSLFREILTAFYWLTIWLMSPAMRCKEEGKKFTGVIIFYKLEVFYGDGDRVVAFSTIICHVQVVASTCIDVGCA